MIFELDSRNHRIAHSSFRHPVVSPSDHTPAVSPGATAIDIATGEEPVIPDSSCHRTTEPRPDEPNDLAPTDQQLLDAFASGETNAIVAVLARYQSFLKYQCRRLTRGNTEDAKDLHSLVLLKVYTEHPQELRRIRHVGGWLRRVAHNKFVDLERSRIAEGKRNEQLKYLSEVGVQRPRSPEQTALDHELVEQLQQAFETLPPRLRAVAEMRFVEDAGYEAIAKQLGITQVNARKRVQEARRRLEEALCNYLALGCSFGYGSQGGFGLAAASLEDVPDGHASWPVGMEGD